MSVRDIEVSSKPRRNHLSLQIPSTYKNSYQECSLIDLDKIFDFQNDCVNMSTLRKSVIHGSLRSSPFRSLIWMILLQVIPANRISSWKKDLKSKRSLYEKFLSCKGKVIDDYYQEMETIINQDIERTHPKLAFFRDENVQTTMRNILLAYSIRQSSGYRQGMHEILAILIFSFHHHQATHFHALENENVSQELRNVLSLFHSDKIIESDLYFTFNKIMCIIYDWYIVKEEDQEGVSHQFCPGVRFIEDIYHNYLPLYSKDLYEHMEKLGITPITFGLKWTRLFFAQEFPLSDVLYIWDAIFSATEKDSFPLVRYIFLSILICLKDVLLIKDFSDALCLLMRVPQEIDVMRLMKLAFHLYKPSIYSKPETSTIISKSFLQSQKAQMIRLNSSTINRSKSLKGFSIFNRSSTSETSPQPSTGFIFAQAKDVSSRRTSFIGTPNFMSSVMEFFMPNTQDASAMSSTKEASTDPSEEFVLINKDHFRKSIGALRSHLDYLKKLDHKCKNSSFLSSDDREHFPDFSSEIARLEDLIQLYDDCLIKSGKVD